MCWLMRVLVYDSSESIGVSVFLATATCVVPTCVAT